MSANSIFPIPKNYQELTHVQHKIKWAIEDIQLELKQLEWVADGIRHPADRESHQRKLLKLVKDLERAIKREAKVKIEYHPGHGVEGFK